MAKALDHAGTKGLPLLSTFSASLRPPVTRVGVEALAHALLKNCSHLKEVALYGVDDDGRVQQMVDEMVVAAGCRHRVRIDINAGMWDEVNGGGGAGYLYEARSGGRGCVVL